MSLNRFRLRLFGGNCEMTKPIVIQCYGDRLKIDGNTSPRMQLDTNREYEYLMIGEQMSNTQISLSKRYDNINFKLARIK